MSADTCKCNSALALGDVGERSVEGIWRAIAFWGCGRCDRCLGDVERCDRFWDVGMRSLFGDVGERSLFGMWRAIAFWDVGGR